MLKGMGLHKAYKSGKAAFPAVNGVDIAVPEQSFVAIMGQSGCGKSTLLNLLAGLDRPDQGEVWIADRRIDNMGESKLAQFRRKHVGIVFQFFHLVQGLSVAANIELPGRLAGVASRELRTRRDELAERLGITKLLGKGVTELSGGEQQRVAIARAVINKPSVLLADEPTGSVDAETAAQILRLLRDLNREGQTIVMVTHDSGVAAAAGQIITMRDGRRMDQPEPLQAARAH